MLTDNCQQRCVCHAGKGLVCQSHSCKPGHVCHSTAGILSCVKGAGLAWGRCGWGQRAEGAEGGVTWIFMVGGAED